MKAVIGDFTTDIYPTAEEVIELCKPGQGADTCIWLMMGADGWFCAYHNRQHVNLVGESLESRWRRGATVAKRDGCEKVKTFNRFDEGREIEF